MLYPLIFVKPYCFQAPFRARFDRHLLGQLAKVNHAWDWCQKQTKQKNNNMTYISFAAATVLSSSMNATMSRSLLGRLVRFLMLPTMQQVTSVFSMRRKTVWTRSHNWTNTGRFDLRYNSQSLTNLTISQWRLENCCAIRVNAPIRRVHPRAKQTGRNLLNGFN